MRLFTEFTLLVTVSLLLVLQSTQAFCVYNDMDEGSEEFTVSKAYSFVGYFKKTMSSGDVECCHFSNKDCNASGDAESLLDFRVSFVNAPGYSFPCSAGGGLVIRGSTDGSSISNFEATCNHPDGTVSTHVAVW